MLEGGPDLGSGTVAEQRELFRTRFDHWRSAIVNEPRGSDAMVGALLCKPADPECDAGVIFFNNVGFIGMCGHGTIGLVVSLAWLGRAKPGKLRIETPVGVVGAELRADGDVVVANVPSYRHRKGVSVTVPGIGVVTGDVAYGGNWFFLCEGHGLGIELANLEQLTSFSTRVRQALVREGITGEGGAQIDHVELFGAPTPGQADSRNFVLCPGNAYDRSPCGTGTSAKMACLHADGKLPKGREWRQQGILGSVFHGSVQEREGRIHPFIRGSAHVTLQGSLVIDDRDPFAWGITAERLDAAIES